MSNPLIQLFDANFARGVSFLAVARDDSGKTLAKLEMNRRQRMPVALYNDADPDELPLYQLVDQITVADVELCKSLHNQGLFRDFLAHLEHSLPGLEAIQLQCVLNKWLRLKLEADPAWLRQNALGENDFNPSYVKLLVH